MRSISSKKIKIAIVGAGMVGLQLAREYLKLAGQKKKTKELEITLFDREDRAGYGGPFLPDHSSLLLNQPQEMMSLRGIPNDYIAWLQKNMPEKANERFTTRMDFGKYAREYFDELRSNPQISFVPQIIIDLEAHGKGWKLTDQAGTSRLFDGVHLATGPLAYQDPYKLKGSKGFLGKPYLLTNTWQSIKDAKKIGVLGTGLATVDVAVYLHAQNYRGKISYISLDGFFPTVRGEATQFPMPNLDRLLEKGKGTLDDMLEAIQADAKANKVPLDKFKPSEEDDPIERIRFQLENPKALGQIQFLIASRNPRYADYWNQLTRSDQQRFQKQYQTLFLLFQSPMPPESARKILKSLEDGQSEILTDVKKITADQRGLRLQRKKSFQYLEFLINATGTGEALEELAYENDATNLIERLVDKAILQKDPNGGLLIGYPSHSAISQRFGILNTLKLHGAMTAGTVFANNAVDFLGQGAAITAREMLRELEGGSE